MDTISIINTDRLYWLGRYSERVYTTLLLFSRKYDELIESDSYDFDAFCRKLSIPNIYTDKADFVRRYAFDTENPDSVISNMIRAHDNAIELREEIGSESLAYIQLAVYSIQKAGASSAPLIELQETVDAILAFWGIVDDQIDDENTRNIIKVGKRVERLDLYTRLKKDRTAIRREVARLSGRIDRCSLLYRKAALTELSELSKAEELDYDAILRSVESILEV